MRHILDARDFDVDFIAHINERACIFQDALDNPNTRNSFRHLQSGSVLLNIFYQPSTRTRLSFFFAAHRLGMGVDGTENAGQFSSAIKGESLEDSVRVMCEYHPDVIVLRHPEKGAAKRAAAVSSVPIINGGDGAGQHPTQATLDLFTINREVGRLEDLTVVMVGDLRYGRTVRSLCYLLAKYPNIRIRFVSPPQLRMKNDIKRYLAKHRVSFKESTSLKKALKGADVVYVTRIQREYFEAAKGIDYDEVSSMFILDEKAMQWLDVKSRILHPLPRVNEIALEVDDYPQAAYIRQAGYGVAVRMALIEWVLAT